MTHKPHILYIATFPPPVHGASMVSIQIKESKLLNETFDGDYVNIGTSHKITEIGKSGLTIKFVKLFRFLEALLKTLYLLIRHKYDLCYCAITCHGTGFIKDTPFVLLCKLFDKKIVIHQHNKGMSKDVDKPLFRWLLPLVYNNTKVILLSKFLYSDIEKIVKKENVIICPNGIKQTKNKSDHKNNDMANLEHSTLHILFLSNLLISKGVLDLLDALEILKDKGYSFVCDFVGGETKDIDTNRFSQEVNNRRLNGVATYHGRKYGKEKEDYLERTDIFVLPTYNECFPLVLLEAMEKGIACISTNEGGIRDIIDDGKNGIIVSQKDVESLTFAIEKLLVNNKLREDIGKASKQKFEENFTEEAFERKMRMCLIHCLYN